MNDGQLRAELDDLLRSMPPLGSLHHQDLEVMEWRGRLAAVFKMLGPSFATDLIYVNSNIDSVNAMFYDKGSRGLVSLLQEARHTLRLRSPTASSSLLETGAVFEYFDEVRKIITTAKSEVFFVDPYADPEFVAKFFTQLDKEVFIKVLAKNNVAALLPAVDTFAKQHGHQVEVRSAPNIHDRFVFLDQRECFQSGASFKDGAKKAPATIVQIIDAFPAMQSTYEGIWKSAKVER